MEGALVRQAEDLGARFEGEAAAAKREYERRFEQVRGSIVMGAEAQMGVGMEIGARRLLRIVSTCQETTLIGPLLRIP